MCRLYRLRIIVAGSEDSIRIYHLCASCLDNASIWGDSELSFREKVLIV
jgi:CRISPR/Cas system-associated endoribonuclease Cas2